MYIGEFKSKTDVRDSFERGSELKEEFKQVEILFAAYGYGDYCGTAFVLFRKDGQLYEVHGGHCSCYGLEGQWEPEETTIEAVLHQVEKGGLGDFYDEGDWSKQLKRLLKDIRRFGV